MSLSLCLLAISVSIDSFGIGVTYGLKNTNITPIAKFILVFLSITITTISMYLGTILSSVFPDYLTNYIGCLLLVCMGFWVILQSFHTDKKSLPNTSINKLEKSPKIHEFFMKGFGITIQIIRNPISSDLDQSKKIDAIEAFYLGIAMSIDSICVGIGSSILGFRSWLFPILVAVFQLLFLFLGKKMGKTLARTSRLPEYIWMILSGVILICIGISKIL